MPPHDLPARSRAESPPPGQRSSTERKHVLILYGWGAADLPGNAQIDQAFRQGLAQKYSGSHYSPALVDRWIEGWLQRLGDRAPLLKRSEPDRAFRFPHQWSAESVEPPLPPGIEELPWTAGARQRGEIVPVDRLADLPADAEVDRQTCQRAGVKSFLAAPMPARNGPS
jgi:hypothetical protein